MSSNMGAARVPRSTRPLDGTGLAAGAGAAVACGAVTALAGGPVAVGAVGAAVGTRLALRVRTAWWPALIVLSFTVLPEKDLPIPGNGGHNGAISLTILLVPLWAVVRGTGRRVGTGVRPPWAIDWWCLALTAWLAVALVLSGGTSTSIDWSLDLLLLTVAPALLMEPAGARRLLRWWVRAGAALGAYALAETFVLGSNPIWGGVYPAGTASGGRATTSLGQPVLNGGFFAVTAALGLLTWLRGGRRSDAVCTVLALGGLVAAGTRGGVIALAVGVLTAMAGQWLRPVGARPRVWRIALVVVLGTLAGVAATGLRSAASDPGGSAAVHDRSLQTGLLIAGRTPWTGVGPGRALAVKEQTAGPGSDERRSIENAWLELYIGLGVPGVVIVGMLLVTALGYAAAGRRWAVLAALLTAVVDYGFSNMLEGERPVSMIMLGLLMGACWADGRPSDPAGRA